MIFLANENIPLNSIKVLRENGFEVKSIGELHPGISDKEVILFTLVTSSRRSSMIL